jgi:competence protein ComEA
MSEGGYRKDWRYTILFSVVSLVIGGVGGWYLGPRPQQSAPISISTPVPTATAAPTATPAPIRVYVSGAVRAPDVVELPVGSIVEDAIEAAGGVSAEADLTRINLALEVQDQQHIYVPAEGETSPPPVISGGSGGGGSTSALVNINTADATALETLPRVGPATAQRIIEHREANGPFETIEDIQDVSGIGPATFDGLKDLITVQ